MYESNFKVYRDDFITLLSDLGAGDRVTLKVLTGEQTRNKIREQQTDTNNIYFTFLSQIHSLMASIR